MIDMRNDRQHKIEIFYITYYFDEVQYRSASIAIIKFYAILLSRL